VVLGRQPEAEAAGVDPSLLAEAQGIEPGAGAERGEEEVEGLGRRAGAAVLAALVGRHGEALEVRRDRAAAGELDVDAHGITSRSQASRAAARRSRPRGWEGAPAPAGGSAGIEEA